MNVRYTLRGTVQGVGFRPHVYRLATRLQLKGQIYNHSDGVVIEVEGSREQQQQFIQQLTAQLPPKANIDAIDSIEFEHQGFNDFQVVASLDAGPPDNLTADIAICETCIGELTDPNNRRFHYPFISCSDCGPRFSISIGAPFDRHTTTMQHFALCEKCNQEYSSPEERRFWAQTTCCDTCGPTLTLRTGSEEHIGTNDALQTCVTLLKQGKIVAVKNTGGYQLIADATNDETITKLRQRKNRATKPFALLFNRVSNVEEHARLSAAGKAVLQSAHTPIVLAPKLGKTTHLADVAPASNELGVMLANSPLQYLLCEEMAVPLVCTSANLSGELMIIDDNVARQQLFELADAILSHDRAISHRLDDSIYRQAGEELIPIRAGRGLIPVSLPLPEQLQGKNLPRTLAFGADMKASFSLLRNDEILCSQYLGDLFHFDAYKAMQQEVRSWCDSYQFVPQQVSCDNHPDYYSTRLAEAYANEHQLTISGVQHHTAHVASAYAEHRLAPDVPTIAVAMDGLGFGDDGTLWGMEFFHGTINNLNRFATTSAVALVGRENAILHPWKALVSYLARAGMEIEQVTEAVKTNKTELQQVFALTSKAPVKTRSLGRLLDAAAALTGCIPEKIEYDGQAPMHLETLAQNSACDISYPFDIDSKNPIQINFSPAWRASIKDMQDHSVSTADVAKRWHNTVIQAVAETIVSQYKQSGEETVVLTGGCMQNTLLYIGLKIRLEDAGLEVKCHQKLPANDSAISVGQAYLSAVKGNNSGGADVLGHTRTD